jgi:hypothetical protein
VLALPTVHADPPRDDIATAHLSVGVNMIKAGALQPDPRLEQLLVALARHPLEHARQHHEIG